MNLNPEYDYNLGKILHLSMFLNEWKSFDILNKKIDDAIKKVECYRALLISWNIR